MNLHASNFENSILRKYNPTKKSGLHKSGRKAGHGRRGAKFLGDHHHREDLEVRWWLNWRTPEKNVEWIKLHGDSITTIHPAHNLFVLGYEGDFLIPERYNAERFIKPYLDLSVDVMPNVDIWGVEPRSAVYSAYVLNDKAMAAKIRVMIDGLVDFLVQDGFCGYIVDYEPHFEHNLEHVRAFHKFLVYLKEAMNQRAPNSRLGVCVGRQGIVNIEKEEYRTLYKSVADFVMTMNTYSPFYPISEQENFGFRELKSRALMMKTWFAESQLTIGLSMAKSGVRQHWWYEGGDHNIDNVVEFYRQAGIRSLSVWGTWDAPEHDPDSKVFAKAMKTYLDRGQPSDTERVRRPEKYRTDLPKCVTGAHKSSSYWEGIISQDRVQSIYPLNKWSIENKDSQWYWYCIPTGIAAGKRDSVCDPTKVYCCGKNNTPGYATAQMMAVAEAAAHGGRHPLAPQPARARRG